MNTMREGPITSNYDESRQTIKLNWTEGPS